MSSLAARPAVADDADALIHTLCRAFDADPILRYALRQDAQRENAYRAYFRIGLLRQTLPYGCVLTNAQRTGAALWTPPHRWALPAWQQLQLLPRIAGCVGAFRIPRALQLLTALEHAHPPAPHYYLFNLAVDPAHQGQGIASALLRPVLRRCDAQGVGAYLETATPSNLPLYEHFGFRVNGSIDLGRDAPPYWRMWREPQPI